MFAFYFSKLAFDQNFIQFLEILIPTSIKEINDNLIITSLGESLSHDDFCSKIFWIFKSFAELYIISSNKMLLPSNKELFLSVKTQLTSISPSTYSMLESRKINDFKFCEHEINSLFLSQRSLMESQLFITSLLSSGSNAQQFISATLCSILVLLQRNLQTIPIEDQSTFNKTFSASLPNLEMRLILFNVENLLGNRSGSNE